jgi:hypothetical protein
MRHGHQTTPDHTPVWWASLNNKDLIVAHTLLGRIVWNRRFGMPRFGVEDEGRLDAEINQEAII